MSVALIVDDQPYNLRVLNQLLAKEGLKAIEISNPSQLMPILDELEDVAVVFLDLEMPRYDGFEVLEILRKNPHFNNVPIIAYTVHVSEIDVAYQQGFDGFLGKPIDSDRFPEQLQRILNGEGVWEIP